MKTLQADEAIAKFRACYDDAELAYEVAESDVNFVRVTVSKDDISIETWFEVDSQLWGFDLLQGGRKSFDKFEEFEDFLATYLTIHTVFIPTSKLVVDHFAKENDLRAVYDNFSGNKKNGYIAKFKVIGAGDQNILVQRVPEGYLLRLVVPDADSQRMKVRAEYKYDIDENGEVSPIPTMHRFVHELKARYANDSSTQIQRVSENVFSFSIEDLVITAEISFNYLEVRYHITEVGCYDADITISPEDPCDLSKVYMACKDFYDDSVAAENEEYGEADSEDAGVDDATGASDGGDQDDSEDYDDTGSDEESGSDGAEEYGGEYDGQEPDDDQFLNEAFGTEESSGVVDLSGDEPAAEAPVEDDEPAVSAGDFDDGWDDGFDEGSGSDNEGAEHGQEAADEGDDAPAKGVDEYDGFAEDSEEAADSGLPEEYFGSDDTDTASDEGTPQEEPAGDAEATAVEGSSYVNGAVAETPASDEPPEWVPDTTCHAEPVSDTEAEEQSGGEQDDDEPVAGESSDESVYRAHFEADAAEAMRQEETDSSWQNYEYPDKATEGKGDSAMHVTSVKLVVESGETVAVQFIADGQPYIFGVEQAEMAGLPVKRIKETVQTVYKLGMRMTEDERKLKRYSDDLNLTGELLEQLIDAALA